MSSAVTLFGQVATPVFVPSSGAYGGTVAVTVNCATPSAVIHYTSNGSDPTESNQSVTSGSAVLIGRNVTLKAAAWLNGTSSAVNSATYQSSGQVMCGFNHSLVIQDDGTLWAWGRNVNGQLGIGSTADQWFPGPVGSLSNVAAVAGGYSFTIAAKSDGTVWVWGQNDYSQLGDGTTTQRVSPVQLSGMTGVVFCGGG